MSTDLHDRTSRPSPEHSPDKSPDQHERPKAALSLTQVVGSALAAMTAAALGSRLGLAGTVAGAAMASVIAAVGGSIYTSSLRRTRTHVTSVLKSRERPGGPARRHDAPRPSTTSPPVAATAPDETRVTARPSGDQPSDRTEAASPAGRRRIGWKPVLVAAVSTSPSRRWPSPASSW